MNPAILLILSSSSFTDNMFTYHFAMHRSSIMTKVSQFHTPSPFLFRAVILTFTSDWLASEWFPSLFYQMIHIPQKIQRSWASFDAGKHRSDLQKQTWRRSRYVVRPPMLNTGPARPTSPDCRGSSSTQTETWSRRQLSHLAPPAPFLPQPPQQRSTCNSLTVWLL